jgi:hypothetical protein
LTLKSNELVHAHFQSHIVWPCRPAMRHTCPARAKVMRLQPPCLPQCASGHSLTPDICHVKHWQIVSAACVGRHRLHVYLTVTAPSGRALQAMAGAEAECKSVGKAFGCAGAKASAKARARAWANALAAASAQAVVHCGKCKVAARATAAGKASLHVFLLAYASATAEASVCVKGPIL